MRLKTYSSAGDFLADTRDYLEAAEEINGLMLGLAIRLVDDPLIYGSPPYLALLSDGGAPMLAALMTPPHNLILYSDGTAGPEAIMELALDLAVKRIGVSGTVGPEPLSEGFASAWQRVRGVSVRHGMSQRIYKLTAVEDSPPCAGVLRVAGLQDAKLVLGWVDAFHDEAVPQNPRTPAELYRQRIASGGIYLWEDGRPVSMAMGSRPTRRGISVGAVYTPPELRRRGYASSCVAALSRLLLDSGYEFLTLFTDLANPTSNAIYQQIGYRPVIDFLELKFEQ